MPPKPSTAAVAAASEAPKTRAAANKSKAPTTTAAKTQKKSKSTNRKLKGLHRQRLVNLANIATALANLVDIEHEALGDDGFYEDVVPQARAVDKALVELYRRGKKPPEAVAAEKKEEEGVVVEEEEAPKTRKRPLRRIVSDDEEEEEEKQPAVKRGKK